MRDDLSCVAEILRVTYTWVTEVSQFRERRGSEQLECW